MEFDTDLTWDNQGTYWHVDHVIPCSKWNLTIEENKKRCFHWSNLSPLEARKNISKGNRINNDQIKEHNRRLKLFTKDNKLKCIQLQI